MDGAVYQKSMDFSVRIVRLYQFLCNERKEYVISKQILRSGTSIGANIREGRYAESKEDFAHKLSIALKETSETEYWLELLYRTDFLSHLEYESIHEDCVALAKFLTAIVKTTKNRYPRTGAK
ncbi:MAG: four helix bundle protein [Oscillospiraceae bacterium]|nr:four helix bundle protein [Oscillospiraceae bacterium]